MSAGWKTGTVWSGPFVPTSDPSLHRTNSAGLLLPARSLYDTRSVELRQIILRTKVGIGNSRQVRIHFAILLFKL